MANTLYTPEQAARSTLAALRYLSVLPRTVRQDFSVGVRRRPWPHRRRQEADHGRPRPRLHGRQPHCPRRDRVRRPVQDTIVPVTMDKQVYSAVRLPDDFATFT